MIRLPSTFAAITVPLLASDAQFPGIPIGRSQTDGRSFRLSPVRVDEAILPATNSLALGGLGSGKSTTAKIRARREILDHGHQYVVIDSFGEETDGNRSGEWGLLTRALGGRVIEAGEFALNPCSPLLPLQVREELIRSLIVAVEPLALTPQATHALQHALNSPKASGLSGLVDALLSPEDGRWPAAKMEGWGEAAAMALTRYTEGSLCGLFDGPEASFPASGLPIITFDFSRLDRNSAAIPALMAAIACWVEHVWLKQSTAPHRHLVLEEAWQILLSPATAELIQRLLKNSRKAALSLDVVMHTLSDQGDGRAQDLAKLCEIVHVGRLSPEEAAKVGAILDLPAWAVRLIPSLAPGEAIWKVGPDFVDVIKTIMSEEESRLTDTSKRRRAAQTAGPGIVDQDQDQDQDRAVALAKEDEGPRDDGLPEEGPDDGVDFEMPPNVVDTTYKIPRFDGRHHAVLQAAGEGRLNEAAQLAALGEHEDIAAHGISSPQATAWLIVRAEVADRSGCTSQALQLRATVAHMANDNGAEWFEATGEPATQWHRVPGLGHTPAGPQPSPPDEPYIPKPSVRRRTWAYTAAAAALMIGIIAVWQSADDDSKAQAAQRKASAYKGRSGASLDMDSVSADVVARWTQDGSHVIVELRPYADPDAQYVRLDAGGKTAHSQAADGWYPKSLEVELPVENRADDVTVRVAIGGKSWKEGTRAMSRTIRLSPTGVAYDAATGERLPSDL
ncbi:hypothetical protein [Streptomyces sp. NPDC087298]|uniref:hypothetical protein n=1 Tax=Streptomyces sp. NPDC087298 TaxID=3365779 RepID=UPI00380D58C6